METLVTGATGFAGRALVEALRAEGHGVRALVRAGSDGAAREALTAAGATLVTGDVRDEPSVLRAAEGCEVVFHCARLDDPMRPRDELEAVNLVGTENTLAACRAAGVRRLVYLSTTDVTRSNAHRSYVDEDHPQPADFVDDAAETRALAEDLVVAASDATFETVTLRAGYIWGAGDACIVRRVRAWSRDGAPAWIDGGRALCATSHAHNLAAAMLCAARASEAPSKVYNLTDDERVSVREFLTRLASALGVTLRASSLPWALAWALAWARDRRGGRGHRAEAQSLGRSAHFNVQRARKELAWAPVVDVSAGLREVSAWVKKEAR